jgi:hypothetical protein
MDRAGFIEILLIVTVVSIVSFAGNNAMEKTSCLFLKGTAPPLNSHCGLIGRE